MTKIQIFGCVVAVVIILTAPIALMYFTQVPPPQYECIDGTLWRGRGDLIIQETPIRRCMER